MAQFLKNRLAKIPLVFWLLGFLILIDFAFLLFFVLKQYYSFHSNWPLDLAFFSQSLFNANYNHDFFYQSVVHGWTSIFSHHFYGLAFLILPIYALIPKTETLLILQTLALASAGIPLFLITKKYLKSDWLALLTVLIFFLYPQVHRIALADFRYEIFAIPFLLWTFYFFIAKNWKLFLIFFFLTLLCGEHLGLTVAVFGVFALFTKKELKWILLPLIVGLLWTFLATEGIAFRNQKIGFVDANKQPLVNIVDYKHWGNNLGEIKTNLLKNPKKTINYLFEEPKKEILKKEFEPLLYSPLLSPIADLFMLPTFLKNHLLNLKTRDFFDSDQLIYYITPMIPFMFIGLLQVIKVLRSSWLKLVVLLLVLTSALISAFQFSPTPLNKDWEEKYRQKFIIDEHAKNVWQAIKLIPKNKSASAETEFLPALAQRKNLTDISNLDPYEKADYILMGFSPSWDIINFNYLKNELEIRHKEWDEIFEAQNVVLFKKH